MSLKSDVLALIFGALLIFVTFGDDHLSKLTGVAVGNLDTILGLKLWPILDVVYAFASVVVFLLYGWAKGNRLRVNYVNSLLLISYLAALVLMNFDDVAIALSLAVYPPTVYWVAISWIYPIYGAAAFFLFGKLHKKQSA